MSKLTMEGFTHNSYTVGWICALSKELTAAEAMLDTKHPNLQKPPNDTNNYTLGSVGGHNVVIVCLPKGGIGTNSCATVATIMLQTFPNIKFSFMVGIGGGVPEQVRLGDVVIGTPADDHSGVVQWDSGKTEQGGQFKRTGSLNRPPNELLNAVSKLEQEHQTNGTKVPRFLDQMKYDRPNLPSEYLKSAKLEDVLFRAEYAHVDSGTSENDQGCESCDRAYSIQREPRQMKVHYGLIASGNQVIKDAKYRDEINGRFDNKVLCFEMEAAGVGNNWPFIVIRGICDYADSHKNKQWQEYAASVAAAAAKELLLTVPTSAATLLPPMMTKMLSSGFDLVKGFFKTGLRGSGQPKDMQQGPNNSISSALQYESNEAERTTGSLGSTDEDQHSPQPTPSSTSLPTANKGTVRDQTSCEAKPEISDVFIGVMGMTGAGKSTFISLVTDQEVVIGNDLKACTQNVTMYRCKFSTSCNIWLIDTPGFDDTNRTDSEVLKEIAGWLAESFSQKVILNGILYLHRILDNRMPGSAKRNLFMLKKLCGKDALRNTILVTTMWDLVDPADGDRREKQLITTPEYWGDMIAAGSQNLRHDKTYESAMRLINLYADSHSTKEKKVLAIQHEMVIEKKALDETDAGKAVEDALIKERSRWRRELDDLREMMKEALAEKDKESAEMLRQNTAEINAKLAAAERAQRDLKVTMEQMHRERLSAFRRDIEAQRRENRMIREKLSTLEASQDRRYSKPSAVPVYSQALSPLSEKLEVQNSKLGDAKAHVQEMEKAHDQGSLDMRGPKYASLLEQLEQHRRELLIVQSNIRGMGQGHGQRYGCDLEPMYSGKLLAQLEGLSM